MAKKKVADDKEVVETQVGDDAPKKRSPIKVIIGVAIIVVLVLLVVWKFNDIFKGGDKTNKYISTLVDYYTAIEKGDANSLKLLVDVNFNDIAKPASLKTKQYDIHIYKLEDSTTTNFIADKVVLYSLIFTGENNTIVSYINEAYMKVVDGEAKLVFVNNVYKGKSVLNK